MTKTRAQMKGKSLVSELPPFPKRVALKKRKVDVPRASRATAPSKTKETTPTKENNTNNKNEDKKRRKNLPYRSMVRETLQTLSSTSTTSSKAVSGQAIARYLVSEFGVEDVNHPHLKRVLQQGVVSGELRKVKQSYLLAKTSNKKAIEAPKKTTTTPKKTATTPKKTATPAPKKTTPSSPIRQSKRTPKPKPKPSTPKSSRPTPTPTFCSTPTPVPVVNAVRTHSGPYKTLGEEVPASFSASSSSSSSSSSFASSALTLTVDIEKNMLSWNKEAKLAGIASLQANKGGAGQRPPADIVCVVDRSGSMSGGKLTLVKQALNYLVSQLGDEDRLSVVSFDHDVYDIFGLRLCTAEGKKEMETYIHGHPRMQAGGLTNIRLGLELGMDFLKKRKFFNPVTAVMLLTDGQGGAPDQASLTRWEKEVGAVPIHCFGFGANHDAKTLADISDRAHGSFTFVENINTVGGAFATCLGGVLSVTAQQVVMKIKCEVPWARIQEVHTTYPVSILADGMEAEVTIPDTISEEKKDIVFFVKVMAASGEGNGALFSCSGTYLNLRTETGRGTTENLREVVCHFARPTDDSGATYSMRVDQERNRIEVTGALQEAVRLGEAKDLLGAQRCLELALQRLQASPSGSTMPHLAQDLHNARARFENQTSYQRQGYAFARQQEQSHRRQRAMGPEATYCNPEQIAQRAANATFNA